MKSKKIKITTLFIVVIACFLGIWHLWDIHKRQNRLDNHYKIQMSFRYLTMYEKDPQKKQIALKTLGDPNEQFLTIQKEMLEDGYNRAEIMDMDREIEKKAKEKFGLK